MSDESYWNSQANQHLQNAQDSWNNGSNWEYHDAQNRAAEAKRNADEARAHQERMNAGSQSWMGGATNTFGATNTPTYGGGYSGGRGGSAGGSDLFSFLGWIVKNIVKYFFLAFLWVGIPLLVIGEIVSQFTVSHQQDLHRYVARNALLTQQIILSSPKLMFRNKNPFELDQYASEVTRAHVKLLSKESLSSLIKLFVTEDKKKKADLELKRAAAFLIGNIIKEHPGSLTVAQIDTLRHGNFGMFLFTPRFQKEDVLAAADYVVFAQIGVINPNYGNGAGLKWYGANWAHMDHAYVLLAKSPGFERELKVVQDAYQKANINPPHYSSFTNSYSVAGGICLLGYCANPKEFELHVVSGLI